uniref:odorant receptor 9a-like n=1 Tax=Vespula vulgaris TaxID=7454 RepID=UPI00223B8A3C|nr:odorant receptor 9a-like [Vespula vulgaris]
MDDIISNLAENIELTMTLTKVAITRVNREALSKLSMEIKEFSLTEKYETKQEKLTLLNYTKLPLYFIVIIASSMLLAESLYYMNGISNGIHIAKQNNSMGYKLPYRTLEIMELKDYRIYALFCAYQLMFIPSIVLGYVGFDCMFVNLSIQVITQFGILSYKVKRILTRSKNYHEGMKELILRHYRLIRLTEELESNFNYPIMQQLMGSTVHICIAGFYVLTSNVMEDTVQFILFIAYFFSVISTLFIYCFIGECFIQESMNFDKAIYNYEWYNLSPTEAKFFLICMIRTQKPQCLTSGKFTILSLTIFTDILKTSMGYLSVLRTFV